MLGTGERHAGLRPSRRLLSASTAGTLGLDPHGRGVDIGDHAAILAEETIAQPLQHVHQRLLVAAAATGLSRGLGGAVGHAAPTSADRPPVPPDGGLPTALRNSVNVILCASWVS